VLFNLEFNDIVESSRRADVAKALILVRCPHTAVATVTLAFARGAPDAACRRRRPRFWRSARGSSWHGLRKPRCRRGGGRATPGDRSMCPSHWATRRHAVSSGGTRTRALLKLKSSRANPNLVARVGWGRPRSPAVPPLGWGPRTAGPLGLPRERSDGLARPSCHPGEF
jgi:hypothetical protein